MQKEWIDIADTAVKIGLGALITGIFTYIGIKFSHKSEQRKFILEHKTKLLEQVANDVDEYLNSLNSFLNIIASITMQREKDKKENEKLTTKEKEGIDKVDNELVKSWPKANTAISKLRLMKATKVSIALQSVLAIEYEIRNPIIFDSKLLTFNEFSPKVDDVIDLTNKVHKELADFYTTFQN